MEWNIYKNPHGGVLINTFFKGFELEIVLCTTLLKLLPLPGFHTDSTPFAHS